MLLVGNRTKNKEIYLCDPDGQGLVQLTKDGKISLAPKWGPDGNTIVYTSYLKGYPDVYSIDLGTGSRNRLAGYPGLNTGADISPNGREVALILSKDGNPELYVKKLRERSVDPVDQYAARSGSKPFVVAGRQPDRLCFGPVGHSPALYHFARRRPAGPYDEPRFGERGPGLGRQRLDRLHDAGGGALPGLRHGPELRRGEADYGG